MDNELYHYGTPRHSGRYPWGSGDEPYQRSKSFLGNVEELRKKGVSDVDIAKGMGITTTQLRAKVSMSNSEVRRAEAAFATKLKDKGYSTTAIAERMGKNESSIRSLLNPTLQERAESTRTTANMLKEAVEKKKYVDIGVGEELHMGVSRTKLQTAVAMLEEEGYTTHYVKTPQLGTGKNTTVYVLAGKGVPYREVYNNRDKIQTITDYSENKGISFLGLEPPRSVDSSRIKIRYAEDGGTQKDGVIELRRGVDDISLGSARYAQVRIAVDGSHYLKGMAMYSDDIPEGADIVFNTNKQRGTPMKGPKDNTVLKPIKDDEDNPFGAVVRQRHYTDANGKDQLSALNIVGYKDESGEEGSWGKWQKTLSSQMLSKQPVKLAKQQLQLAFDKKQEEFKDISELTNPAVKKRLLDSFADSCDSDAVHLKAAALPRQSSHVLLPLTQIKDTEIYAPNYLDGERVVLIRYPHAGQFEIPELTVNNRNPSGRRLLGQAKDAVGIHPNVAARLSGADFDGDTVLVIPNPPKVGIKTQPKLKELADFNPKEDYKGYEGMTRMTKAGTQQKMGDISNLITDMTIKGAVKEEIVRAVKHSMVVIDAEKHNLDYKRSYQDQGIAALKKKYQGRANAGASTLVSKASSPQRVGMRKELRSPNRMTPEQFDMYKTGKKVYVKDEQSYVNKAGKTVRRTLKSTKMQETDDAYTLSSGSLIEDAYAAHANKLKALANQARKASIETERTRYEPSAKKTYQTEVDSLQSKLRIALRNAPMERQAQLLANSVYKAKLDANPDLTEAEKKKIRGQALMAARLRVGANKKQVEISDKEWEAIQAGAISQNTLSKILMNTDLDRVKELATPRTFKTMTPNKVSRAKAMLSAGHTQAEVAQQLGVSVTTLRESL